MDCEMSPMLQQQQELMSQSPSEATKAARNSDSAARIKRGRERPRLPPMCLRGYFCQPNCGKAFRVALAKWQLRPEMDLAATPPGFLLSKMSHQILNFACHSSDICYLDLWGCGAEC